MRKNRPLRAVRSATNRYGLFEKRLTLALSPDQRVAAAADYLRSALKRADPVLAAGVAERVVEALTSAARELESAAVTAAERRRHDRRSG